MLAGYHYYFYSDTIPMPGNWKRKTLLKQKLNLEKLKQCPSSEVSKKATFRTQI